ncbi:MAG: NADH-quinone oxidoreductase subunit H [Elusimicrobia bacterium]|nr:NADH-quinone oxidoreductase subunit H [Elusimicrobiota bacterium]
MSAAMGCAALALAGAPLLPGLLSRVKARFGGRSGRPLLQAYFDLAKLARKGAVYSPVTTAVFRAGPVVQLACALAALAVLPFGGRPGLVSFPGDFAFLAGLFAAMRAAQAAAALDTGSSFEGMGASRELAFGALAEPALFLALAALARSTGRLTLAGMLGTPSGGAVSVLAGAALSAVFLAEGCRIPVDDPDTHLELTMVHEVMVLDHSGPDLAFIQYASVLKLWALGTLAAAAALPSGGAAWGAASLLLLAGLAGVVESTMARLRLSRVPQLLTGAAALAALALMAAAR